MISLAFGILVGVISVALFDPNSGLLRSHVRTFRIVTVVLILILIGLFLLGLEDADAGSLWRFPHSPFALFATGLGTIFLVEWALLARSQPANDDERKRLARTRTGLVVMGAVFLFAGLLEVSTPRLIKLFSKVPTPLGVVELVGAPRPGGRDALFDVPSVPGIADKDKQVSDALKRIINLKVYVEGQDRFAAALQAQAEKNSKAVQAAQTRTPAPRGNAATPADPLPFDTEAYVAVVVPLAVP